MKYGVALQPILQIRSKPDETSELTNQVLFGEHFSVLNIENNWAYIRLTFDQYEGWTDLNTITEITEEEYLAMQHHMKKLTLTSGIFNRIKKLSTGEEFFIPAGSPLPFFKDNVFKIKEIEFQLITGKPLTPKLQEKTRVVELSRQFMNAPYLWGGRTYFGLDCSGFIQLIYRMSGCFLPRDTSQQIHYGKTVNQLNEAHAGDLCFFHKGNNRVSHVGLYAGNNKIIHASGKVRLDEIRKKGIVSFEKVIHNLMLIRRL